VVCNVVGRRRFAFLLRREDKDLMILTHRHLLELGYG
jgi:hypothetical protein